jgi:DNA-binding CsgD family transcriptional regulator
MQKNGFFFPQDIYKEHLAIIRGVNFTLREIDVIACFVNARGTHKTASLLSIAPNTVLVHARNIMGKIECHTRDKIIDFIERSDKLLFLREHYTCITIEAEFTNALKNISKLKCETNWTEGLISWEDENVKDAFMEYLVGHLKHANIHAVVKEQKKSNLSEITMNPDQILLFFIEKKIFQKTPHQLSGFTVIDLSKEKNYYFAVFSILKKLFSHAKLDSIFKEFAELHKDIEGFSKSTYFHGYKNEIPETNEIELIYIKWKF